MPIQISIFVYKGVPLDFSKYRHTALHAQYSESEQDWLHVGGANPIFTFQRDSKDPSSEPPIAQIPVCTAPESIIRQKICVACLNTPVRNGRDDLDWNCQNWVGDALTELVKIGCVTKEERSAAINEMVGVILDAKDEECKCLADIC